MFFLKKKNYQTPNIINKFQGHEKLQAEFQVVAEALGCFFVFNRTFLILDLSDFSPPLLIRFRLCSPGQKNYISDAVSPWCQIWRWMMSSCPLWVIFDHLFGQNVWFIYLFIYFLPPWINWSVGRHFRIMQISYCSSKFYSGFNMHRWLILAWTNLFCGSYKNGGFPTCSVGMGLWAPGFLCGL